MSDIAAFVANNLEIWTSAIERKSTSGRNASKTETLYGVARLRELILELAVSGKLVPQYGDEEPAAELLDRLIRERGAKKRLSPASQSSPDFETMTLPKAWVAAQLGDLATIIRGITFPSSEKSKLPGPGKVACLRTSNVQDQLEWDDLLYIRENFVKKDEQYLRPFDLIISMANSRALVGKVAIVEDELPQVATLGGFIAAIRTKGINPHYLKHFFRAPRTRNVLIEGASQTTNIANISLAKLRPLVVPLPPLAEQERIVAKVDELMALCDTLQREREGALDAHQTLVETLLATLVNSTDAADLAKNWARLEKHFDTLFTTETSIDALKQTILDLAVRGKLTGVDILGSAPIDQLFELLDGDRGKNYPKKHDYLPEGHCLFLSTKNVRRDGFLFDETQYISEEKHKQLNQGTLDLGDLVITTRGTLGNVSYYDETIPYPVVRINSGMLIMRPKGTKIAQEFMMLFVQSPSFDEQMRSKRSGSAQPQIPARVLRTFMVPVFERHQQHRIVEKVDKLMAVCDALKSRLADAAETQRHLADAIVERAAA